ncbi:MAG: HepT-like ribonuclease domain-containing protein [Promethearchaeati archaeon]
MDEERKRLFIFNHIFDAYSQISKYLENIDYDNFQKNRLLQDSVMRELEINGEASKNLLEDFRNKFPDIPWRLIAGMRDKLIHGYFSIDIIEVWNIAKRDILDLKKKLELVFNKLKNKLQK